MVTHVDFQAAVDAANVSSHSLVTGIVMRRDFWLQSFGFPSEAQNTIEGFPFDECKLFNDKRDESLHWLKDSTATLWSVDVYVLWS